MSERDATRAAALAGGMSEKSADALAEHAATVCAKCRHVYVVNKSDAWYRWLCFKMPQEKWFNPVTGDTVADPPYYRCKDTNHGDCVLFEQGPNSLNPRFYGEQP